jgi:hypothetical protein
VPATASSPPLAAPDFHTAPDYSITLGPEVADLAAMAGFEPYPEQRLLLDDVFALDPKNPEKSAAFSAAAICARQQLKTGFIKMCALGWLFLTDQPLVIWSAHEFGTAQEAFRDMQGLIEGCDDLSRRVLKVRTAAGSEGFELRSGARLRFKARTGGGGRGLTGSKVILDEAFALEPSMMGALLPTLIAVPDPQVLYGSSAGMSRSEVLRNVRDRGRKGSPRLAYAEWLAPRMDCAEQTCSHAPETPGCVLDDKDLWRKACIITARKDPLNMAVIADLRADLPPGEFMRECLGWWDEPLGDAPIPGTLWDSMLDPMSKPPAAPSFALDVSPERDWACIVAAGRRADEKMHVEITSRQLEPDHRQGTGWVVPRLRAMRAARGDFAVGIAAGSAAESLVPDLEASGQQIVRIPSMDVVAACGRFYDFAVNDGLRHLGQDALTQSVTGARQKRVGERAFVWVRRPGVDLTPMYAATLASWLADNAADISNNVW